MMDLLQLVEGEWIELDGRRCARLVENLPPSLVYRLAETLEILADANRVEELEDEVAELENQVEALEAQLAKRRAKTKS
jgi:hypothetical protein